MVKKLLYILAFTFIFQVASAQEIDYGFGLSFFASAKLEAAQDPTFYFADDVNSSYTIETNSRLRNRYLASPMLYLSYWLNNHFTLRYNISFHAYMKRDKILISNNNIENLESDIKYKYDFLNQSISALYFPIKTREVQPYFGGGIELRSNVRMKEKSLKPEDQLLKNDQHRGQIVDAQIRSLKPFIPALELTAGFEYYIFNVNVTYSKSLGPIQQERYVDFYQTFDVLYMNFCVRFLHDYHKSKIYHNQSEYNGIE